MKLGILAGNGRFPFLVLEAARAQGHEVTIIAIKEETFTELNTAAERHAAPIHWISLGQLGTCINLLKNAHESGSPPDEVALGVQRTAEGGAILRVLDRGRGMDPEVMERALLPFYSSKASGTR